MESTKPTPLSVGARRLVLAAALTLLVFGPKALRGAVIYDNGASALTSGFEITQWLEADQFSLNSASILTSIRFWDLEGNGASFQSSIVWEIRSNAAGNPGTVIFNGTSTNLTHVATGRIAQQGYPEFVSTFDLPAISLPAGSYWIDLHNGPLSNTTYQDYIFWATSTNSDPTPSRTLIAPFTGTTWDSNSPPPPNSVLSKLAFQLSGVPATLLPRISAFALPSGIPTVSFTTTLGQSYRVEYKNNLTDSSWTALTNAGNVSGTGNVVQISDPDPNIHSVKHRFYHVVLNVI